MRRLPGVSVIDVPSPAGDGLPPMDVPVLVGFAERGPLHRPVLLEDAAQYAAVFGGTLDLVSADDGTVCRAHLSAAVNAFFAGGGRRCHVIRVAGAQALASRFEVPGLALFWRRSNGGAWLRISDHLTLRASSPGAWADRFELSSRLRSVALHDQALVALGDVLRIRDGSGLESGYLRVTKASTASTAIASALAANVVCWMSTSSPPSMPSPPSGFASPPPGWIIESLSLDLAVREPANLQTQQAGSRWQREQCGLAAGSPLTMPWFEGDAVERLDLGQPLRELSGGAWPLAGAKVDEIDTDEGPFKPQHMEWMLVPHGVSAFFEPWMPAQLGQGDALERNGLAHYSSALFVDPAWSAELHGAALSAWADQTRYFGAPTRRLQGLHAALGFHDNAVREASWIAVPDAVHVGWEPVAAPPVVNGYLALSPDSDCSCDPADFALCTPPPRAPAAPVLSLPTLVPAEVAWFIFMTGASPPSDAWPHLEVRVEIQIAATADFSDQRPLPQGFSPGAIVPNPLDATPEWAQPVPTQVPLNLPAGLYFLRARAWRSGLHSPWSATATVLARAGTRRLLSPPTVQVDSVAYQVHAALIDLASTTREHFALLSVPAQWDEAALTHHVSLLRQGIEQRQDGAHSLSFAALHHPWLQQRDPDGLSVPHPPEGSLLAQYALRTRSKGSWSAAGLDALVLSHGVAAPLDPGLLEAAGINPIEVRPRGVSATRAATLDTDTDWSAIGVRRLFILLRKLARREGERYAFEPNGAALRRSLERGFEVVLLRLMQGGAFLGTTASECYSVRTATGLQLDQEIERGQCSLEIRVAPSRPLRFLTLYVVRSGEQWQLEERD